MSTRTGLLDPITLARRPREPLAPRLAHLLGLWIERHRQRRALAGLDDHLLKDIGIGRADAWQESRKPFWRA